MSRHKIISDQEAIQLVNEYLAGPCFGIVSKLKLPEIAEYIKQRGYPEYRVETLRRSPAVREYIESLRGTAEQPSKIKLVSFQSLDIETFLDSNRTRGALTKALSRIDLYYKTIADTANEILKKDNERNKEIAKLKEQLAETTRDNEDLRGSLTDLKERVRDLSSQNAALRKALDKYVYPEMVEILLEESGLTMPKTVYVDPAKAKAETIRSDTRLESKVIEGMFKKFED